MRNLTRRFLILLATILVGLNYQVATVYAAEDAPVDVPIDELALKLQEQQVAEQETETEVTEVGVEGDDVLLAGLCEVEARGITDPDQDGAKPSRFSPFSQYSARCDLRTWAVCGWRNKSWRGKTTSRYAGYCA